MRKTLLYLLELVADVVDQSSDTGSGNATCCECKGIYDNGNTSESEAYKDDRV